MLFPHHKSAYLENQGEGPSIVRINQFYHIPGKDLRYKINHFLPK